MTPSPRHNELVQREIFHAESPAQSAKHRAKEYVRLWVQSCNFAYARNPSEVVQEYKV
jgi:hypothetical protein